MCMGIPKMFFPPNVFEMETTFVVFCLPPRTRNLSKSKIWPQDYNHSLGYRSP